MFAATKSLQSCPTLCDPIKGSPPGSAVPGILQARTWITTLTNSLIQMTFDGSYSDCFTFMYFW